MASSRRNDLIVPQIKILFKATNCDFEEGYRLEIYEENNLYFVKIEGYSCLCGNINELREVSSQEALDLMMEEVDNEDDSYLYT